MPPINTIVEFERALTERAGAPTPAAQPVEVVAVWPFAGVEVALAREVVPTRSLGRVWRERRGSRATPLLLVAPGETEGRVAVVGPAAAEPIREVEPEALAVEIARLRRVTAIRAGRALLETLDRLAGVAVAGVEVRGLLTAHFVRARLPRQTVMGGVSEFFSDQLGVHVLKAQRQRAEMGLPIGPIPFGYVAGPSGEPPLADVSEAEAVRDAFASRAAGLSNGAIAASLNKSGLRTRTGRLFTAHALKDLFNCRFYTGVVVFRDQVYPGRHEALVSGELFDRVQARRARRGAHRGTSDKPRGVLAGIIKCARCGNALHAERGHQNRPMYRERHGQICDTNRRSLMSEAVDEQIADIFRSIELHPDWRTRIGALVQKPDGPSMTELRERRGRLARAYSDGGYTLAEYEARLAALDAEIAFAAGSEPVEADEIAALLADLPSLWAEAMPDERRRLIGPFIERVYIDVESKRISGIVPVPAFRALLDTAIRKTADCSAVLCAPSVSVPAHGILELVETGEN